MMSAGLGMAGTGQGDVLRCAGVNLAGVLGGPIQTPDGIRLRARAIPDAGGISGGQRVP